MSNQAAAIPPSSKINEYNLGIGMSEDLARKYSYVGGPPVMTRIPARAGKGNDNASA